MKLQGMISEIMQFDVNWLELEDMFSEICQKMKDKHRMISHIM